MLKYTYERINLIYDYIRSEEFLKLARFKDTSFSRLRKLSLEDTVLSSLSRKGKTLKMDVMHLIIKIIQLNKYNKEDFFGEKKSFFLLRDS